MSKYTLGNLTPNGLRVLLKDGEPTNATASDRAIFGDDAEIVGGEFRGGVFIGGEFRGGVFRGGVFIGGELRGGWLPLQIQGSRHLLNIPDGKTIQIGCKNGTPAWWRLNYKQVGKEQDYSEAQIAEYYEYIKLATKIIKAQRAMP